MNMYSAALHNSAAARRTLDGAGLTSIANEPEIRPWLMGDGTLDLVPIVANPSNFAFADPDGGFLGINCGAGDYDVHSIFRRGAKTAPALMASAMDYMFTRTDCQRLITKVPALNPHARALAEAAGFVEVFSNAVLAVSCMALTIDSWVAREVALETDGEWFHEQIVMASTNLPLHPHDPMHDRAVGAAARMFKYGNPTKAAWFYNRWAAHAGYPGFQLLSEHPVLIDMGECVVEVAGDHMDVLRCQ